MGSLRTPPGTRRIRPGSLRLFFGLGIAFFGLLYLTILCAVVFDGQVEVEPTVVSIEAAERGEFPERRYLRITGGYVAFSEAKVAFNSERELLFVVAPVVSQSVWLLWQSRLGKGVPLDARGVRLLAWFRGGSVAERWPDVARRLEAGQPPAWPVAKLDIEGGAKLASNTLGAKSQYKNLEDSLDWEQLRVLTFGDYHASLGGLASTGLTALGLFALALVILLYQRSRPPAKLGDVRVLEGEPSTRQAPRAGYVPCTMKFEGQGPGELRVVVCLRDSKLMGRNAQLYIEVEAHSNPTLPLSPTHARRVVFTKDVELASGLAPIDVSMRELGLYLYQGETLEVRLYAMLAVDNGPVMEERVDLPSLKLEAAHSSYDPAAGHALELNNELPLVALYKGIKKVFLSSSANLEMQSVFDEARGDRQLAVNELFEGTATVDLEDASLQVIVRTTEHTQGSIFSRLGSKTVEAVRAVREHVIYQKQLPRIAKGQAIGPHVDGVLHFRDLFGPHCPPLRVTDEQGIGFQMAITVTHPDHPEVRSGWLTAYPGEDKPSFRVEDFVEPV